MQRHRLAYTHWVTGGKGGPPSLKPAHVAAVLCLPVCVSVTACLWPVCGWGCWVLAYVSRVCSVRMCLCSHHHHLPADTKFPILSQQREWKEGKSAEAGRGWAGKVLSAAAQAPVPSQGQVPAPQPPLLRGRDRAALGRRAACGGRDPGSGPATWHVGTRQGHCAGAHAAHQRSPGQEVGARACFPSDRSIPAPPPLPVSESPGAPLPGSLPAGLVGHIPGSPLPAPSTLRERESRDKGAWDPSPPAGSPRPTPDALSRCTPLLLLLPQPCAFSEGMRGMKGERGRILLSQIKGLTHTNG